MVRETPGRDGRRSPVLRTGCGREVSVTRLRVDGGQAPIERVSLSISCQDHDGERLWTSLTPDEARRLARWLFDQAGPAAR
ncbi:hypothetical protein B0I33_107143 [Prauserella shujinwangii]|uniref:Uncharacterized protein n=1 Tax=Prauserella shujinwangii TaxID=1453103 RepID=A0A2T0LSC9_9PSEU|nr:hypothetical protein [Prauserella shujinwangii]PRX46566.1 hypothetical protein B0I33_107143 [Prauserella shujinwangii]